MDDLIKDLFKNYLKIVDNYIVPFLRSQNGMWVIMSSYFLNDYCACQKNT